MIPRSSQTEDQRLRRELRYFCIMGPQRRPGAIEPTAPEVLVSHGLVDQAGVVTAKGHDFMRA